MKKRNRRRNVRLIKSLSAWGIALGATAGMVALGLRLVRRFPAFDPLPLFGILAAAFTAACVVNRISAVAFAHSHFGMPYEERTQHMANHAQACRQDPQAVMKQYDGMVTAPICMLGLYFLMTLSLIVTGTMCRMVPEGSLWYAAAAWAGIVGGCAFLYMPVIRILEVLPSRPRNPSYLPRKQAPILYEMARRAADTVGIRGNIELEILRECDCDVNRHGDTYVVLLGTRLMAVLTPAEMEQAMIMAFASYPDPKLDRRVNFRYRLGLLGEAKVRPATFAFDLFFSYADASLEWEYDLYRQAAKRHITNEGYRCIQERGDVSAALGALTKKAFWSYFTFEYPYFIKEPYLESPTPPADFERRICEGFSNACMSRGTVWRSMMNKDMEGYVPDDVPYRYERTILDPTRRIAPSPELPNPATPYGEEIHRLIRENSDKETYAVNLTEYQRAREREYLEPLRIVEAYEKDPTRYSSSELSPVINGYRDIGKFEKAESICDGILEREHNQFAIAHALYFKGMCRLHRYETEGIDQIYRAIDLNKNYMKDGFEMVGEYCVLCGLSDEYAAFCRRSEIQLSAHAYNQEGASYLASTDYLTREDLGDMLPDILGYMEQVADGCIREIYLVRKVISPDFFTSAFVINFDYGVPDEQMRDTYSAIFNYLDAYPVDWQFSLFVYDRETERAVKRVEGSLVWRKNP